jgi:hypothetical protein
VEDHLGAHALWEARDDVLLTLMHLVGKNVVVECPDTLSKVPALAMIEHGTIKHQILGQL